MFPMARSQGRTSTGGVLAEMYILNAFTYDEMRDLQRISLKVLQIYSQSTDLRLLSRH